MFNRRDVVGIAVLTHTVSIRRKSGRSNHCDLMVIDRRRFTDFSEYLQLFWPDLAL